jgi:hypothetical protein
MWSRKPPEGQVVRLRRRRRSLRLIVLIAGLVVTIWAVHWYFFEVPRRALLPATPSTAQVTFGRSR